MGYIQKIPLIPGMNRNGSYPTSYIIIIWSVSLKFPLIINDKYMMQVKGLFLRLKPPIKALRIRKRHHLRLGAYNLMYFENSPIKIGPLSSQEWHTLFNKMLAHMKTIPGNQRFLSGYNNLDEFIIDTELAPQKPTRVERGIIKSIGLEMAQNFVRYVADKKGLDRMCVLKYTAVFMELKILSLKIRACIDEKRPYNDLIAKTNRAIAQILTKEPVEIIVAQQNSH
jgi:hypothetical protein